MEMGCSGKICWRRLVGWYAAGPWAALHRALLERLPGADRLDWSRASLDGASVRARRGARRPDPIRRTAARRARSGTWSPMARARCSAQRSAGPTGATAGCWPPPSTPCRRFAGLADDRAVGRTSSTPTDAMTTADAAVNAAPVPSSRVSQGAASTAANGSGVIARRRSGRRRGSPSPAVSPFDMSAAPTFTLPSPHSPPPSSASGRSGGSVPDPYAPQGVHAFASGEKARRAC